MALEDQIIILVILIIFSGFFSGAETALFSLSKLRVEHLVERKKKGMNTVKYLKDKPHTLLVTLLIGNNLVNIAASALATTIVLGFFSNNVIGITTGAMTFLILTFGEILPKNLALNYNVSFSIMAAKPLYFLSILFYPVIKFYELFDRMIKKRKKPIITEEEIKSYVSAGYKEGEIKEKERDMINRIFRFDDVKVEEIMTPEPDMLALNSEDQLREHIKLFTNKPYTRIPVYRNSRDNIIGVIHLKDVLRYCYNNKTDKKLKSLMKPIIFIPENKKIDSLLKTFQSKNQHMAIVVDEHGSVIGLITLEDILEEIVGEIQDETDEEDENIEKINQKKWKVSAKASLKEVNQKIKCRLKHHEDFETFGGYILYKIGRIPKRGEIIKVGRLKIKINRKAGQRIIDVIVWKI